MKTKERTISAILASLTFIVMVIVVVIPDIPDRKVPPRTQEGSESPQPKAQDALLENGGVEMSSSASDDFYDLPVPISAKDLHNLKPLDDGRIILEVKTEFVLAPTVVLISFGDVDESQIQETGHRIAEVIRLEIVKGEDDEAVGENITTLNIKPLMVGMAMSGGYVPEVNRWSLADILAHRQFIVFINRTDRPQVDKRLATQIEEPRLVRAIANNEYEFDKTLQELRFLAKFADHTIGEQLNLPGVEDYFNQGGRFGGYLGEHLSILYKDHQPSVRPKMLPIIEQLQVDASNPIRAAGFVRRIETLFMRHADHDYVGSALLLGLKAMRSLDWKASHGLHHALANQYEGLIRMVQNNREVAKDLVRRDIFKSEIAALKTVSETWNIKNSDDERSLILVNLFLTALEELE